MGVENNLANLCPILVYVINLCNNLSNSTEVGANYTYTAGTVLVSLEAGAGANSGFSLEMYSSGDLDAGGGGFTHYATYLNSTGATSYPGNGLPYNNDETAVFIVSPSQAGSRTLTFTGMDVEGSTGCIYDSVEVFAWEMGGLSSKARWVIIFKVPN